VDNNKLIIERRFEVVAAMNLKMPVLLDAIQFQNPEYHHP
jgi:hypothetical protein